MIAYKKYVTITDPDRLVLSGLPFRAGQRVEVLLIAETTTDRAARVQELRELLQTTQELPAAQAISEAEIAAEIAAYRSEQ
jgi:hypothetical protein